MIPPLGPKSPRNRKIAAKNTPSMAEQALTYALTTLQRVKDVLFDPNNYLNVTGTTNGSTAVITAVSPLVGVQVGQVIAGLGIVPGSTIVSIGSNSLTISNATTSANTATPITIVNQPAAFDAEITRMINGATDFIQGECGGRKFLQQEYINEVFSGTSYKQRRLILRQFPVTYVQLAGDVTAGSNTILNCTNLNGVKVGMPIFGPGTIPQPMYIPQNGSTFATVTNVGSDGKTLTISVNAAATQLQAQLEISGLVNLEFRSGTPTTNPAWTNYIPDQFELKDQGRAGIIRVYGYIQRIYDNSIRATYWAGYLVNWANAGDNLTHTLPADLTRTCENLVVRSFKRRQLAGQTSVALMGATTSYDKELSTEDKAVILRYKKVPIYF